jgi:alpha-galactosidase
MTGDEYRTHMSLWSLLAAPLLAGNDLRAMTEETKSILMNTEVIAIDQDPAGKPVKRVSQSGETEVLARPLHDGSMAVGLFNRSDQPAEISVKWETLGLGGKKLRVRDLWKHQDVESTGDHYSAVVPTHGVVLLRVAVTP